MKRDGELEVIQHMYDLILWSVPLITRFPVPFRAVLGDRMQTTLGGAANRHPSDAAIRNARRFVTVG